MQQVLDKDMDDLHIKPSDAMNRSKWRKMTEEIRATAAVTVKLRVEYDLYVSDAGSTHPR